MSFRPSRRLRGIGMMLGACLYPTVIAVAQAPGARVPTASSATPLLRTVNDLVARGDTTAALAALDKELARNRKQPALWHRYGMLAWGGRKQSVRNIEDAAIVRLRIHADTALRVATELAPDSGQYWLDYGRFIRFTDNSPRRQRVQEMFEIPAQRALAAGRVRLASELFDEQGLNAFRNYELEMNRYISQNNSGDAGIKVPSSSFDGARVFDEAAIARTQEFAMRFRHQMAKSLESRVRFLSPPSGRANRDVALRSFGAAVTADFTNPRARQHLAMILAETGDWPSLVSLAQRAVDADSGDVQGWLALGIGNQRLEQYPQAAIAFDRAMQQMTETEALTFTDLSRLLTPDRRANTARFPDSVSFAAMSAVERKRWQTLYWQLADPRARTAVNEALTEYLARVAFADLRYSYEELDVIGSRSDRGVVHIRFGPPDRAYGPGDAIWTYRTGRIFYFRRTALTYGNAQFTPAERLVVQDSILLVDPNGWETMPLVRNTWPMLMRVARFRAGADSMDAVVTAAVPVRSFLGDADLTGAFPIDVQIDVHDAASRVSGRELRRATVKSDSLPVGLNGAWVRRIGRGLNIVRVDADQPDVGRAASATADAMVDGDSGFGMSDILFGTNPARTGGRDPVRWSDVSIAPTIGVFKWNQPLGLLWETYELAMAEGNASYRTTITLERTFKSTLKGFAARITANFKNLVERDGSGTGRVAVNFDQKRPTGTVVTDFLTISLDGAAPGPYRLNIAITDLVSGKTVTRTANFVLTPD